MVYIYNRSCTGGLVSFAQFLQLLKRGPFPDVGRVDMCTSQLASDLIHRRVGAHECTIDRCARRLPSFPSTPPYVQSITGYSSPKAPMASMCDTGDHDSASKSDG